MKKKAFILAIIIVFIVLIIPKKTEYWDGGTIEYKAILYKFTKYHTLDEQYEGGFHNGITIKLFGFTIYNTYKVVDIPSYNDEQFMLGYTLDDGRLLHLTFEPSYKNKGLGESLFDKTITIDDITKKLDFVDGLKDGGSKIYKYEKNKKTFGNENFYMIVCDSIDGINDIYIARNMENLNQKCSLKIDDLDNVSMKIKKDTLTNKSATVIITDTSNRKNIYGNAYKIEKQENKVWIELVPKNELVFTSIGYEIGKDNTLVFNIDWEYHYGKLETGKYRILKSTSEIGEGTEHYITAEFSI